MSERGLPAGWSLVALDAVGSTNDEAASRAEAGAPEGTIVQARRQLAGRGRRGRSFQSPIGNSFSSLIVRPGTAPDRAAQLGFVTALAVGEALRRRLPPERRITFKWPNDVLVDGAKIAGILLESAARGDGKVAYVIVGVGVNLVWHPPREETSYGATSVAAAGGSDTDVAGYVCDYAHAFAAWLARWRQSGFAPVGEAWMAQAANLGERIVVRGGREEIVGVLRRLDGDGALILETGDGGTRRITAGEIFPAAS